MAVVLVVCVFVHMVPMQAANAEGVNSAVEAEVSFRNDVMAVLSKAGCNQGTCHGNKNGKGGFKLSLRGQDPEEDLAAITRDQMGRRVNAFQPEESLLLLKATAKVPHMGGRRFREDSQEYAILRAWISSGMTPDRESTPRLTRLIVTPREKILVEPERSLSIQIEAHYSDGTQRDVRDLAVFETSNQLVTVSSNGELRAEGHGETTVLVRYLQEQVPVRVAFVPDREETPWPELTVKNYIDEHVFGKLKSLRAVPAPLCSDRVFLRRAYLDVLGLLPTAEEARAFLGDDDPYKREVLIDELLERPEFADWWALKWSDLLRNEEKVLDRKGVRDFHQWIRRHIEQDRPLNELVHELISARGSTYVVPAANYYRAHRDPVTRAESAAQVFLGTRLQCAKCHNHPFDRWTQDDYYGWAALFSRVRYKILENRRRDNNDGHEFDGEQVVWMDRDGELSDPRTGQPAVPRFLGVADALSGDEADRLASLADWLAAPTNRRFVLVQVNRIWYHLLGRGIVDPVDDFRDTNPPSHPELLEALADDFAEHDFSLKYLVRRILHSTTYQLSSHSTESSNFVDRNFGRALVRRLTAEQLADAVDQVTGSPTDFGVYPVGTRAAQVPGILGPRRGNGRLGEPDPFLTLFGKPVRLLACECERSTATTMGQAFQLISGPRIHSRLTSPGNKLDQWLSEHLPPEELVDDIFWTALSRSPTEEERQRFSVYLGSASDPRAALEDVTWALLNSKEFLLRH